MSVKVRPFNSMCGRINRLLRILLEVLSVRLALWLAKSLVVVNNLVGFLFEVSLVGVIRVILMIFKGKHCVSFVHFKSNNLGSVQKSIWLLI